MQKIVSSLIYSIAIFLLSVSCMSNNVTYLTNLPFYQEYVQTPYKDRTITAKSLKIQKAAKKPTGMYAKAYCLIDADSNRILCSKDADSKLPMASTTKIMTCIVALENSSKNEIVKVSDYAASMPDVQLNMVSGDKFYLKDLLYSLMLESHNDTAVAIAEHIGGSVEGFAQLMNEKALEIGCKKTHFVTPNGLDNKEHYTTAYELCLIASYAIQNKNFLHIINTASHSFTNCDKTRSYSVNNKDAFLRTYKGSFGIKTGFTGNAGYCFCGAARRNGITLISSVLACGWPPDKSRKWSDTKKLMDYGFNAYQIVNIAPDTPLPDQKVTGGQSKKVPLKRTSTKDFSILMSQNDTLTIRYDIPKSLSAPVRQGDIIGYENYFINNKLYCQFPIAAASQIPTADFSYFKNMMYHLFFMKKL